MTAWLGQRREGQSFRAPKSIFWVAFGLRLLVIVAGHTYRIRSSDAHFDFGFEAGRIAQSLATGHGYGNPFNGYSGPTAWLPPLFPLLLAGCFKVFGVYSRGAAMAITALDSLFSALIAPALYEIAARVVDAGGFVRRGSVKAHPVALWSAWLWAAYPGAMQYAVHWVWEMSLSTCLLTWAVVVTLRLRGVGETHGTGERGLVAETAPVEETGVPARRERWPQWVTLGVLWGAITLSNASLILFFAASLGWLLWPWLRKPTLRPSLLRRTGGAVLACAIFGAVLAPWIVRNERVLHAFVPTRANFGVEFWHSTQFDQYGPLPWGVAMPMSSHQPEFERYVREGEVRYAQEKGALARANLRARPGLFMRYTLERMQFFWFCTPHPEEGHPVREYLRVLQYAATSLAGLLGLAVMLQRRMPGAGLIGLAFLTIPLVYYAVTVQPRFRHPLEPLLTLCAIVLLRATGARGVDATTV